MKKAKDYARQYIRVAKEKGQEQALAEVLTDLIAEIGDLAKRRKAEKDPAMVGILNELELKWKAVCRIIPGLNPELFSLALRELEPKAWLAWQVYRRAHQHG
jgi:hypothetical protein